MMQYDAYPYEDDPAGRRPEPYQRRFDLEAKRRLIVSKLSPELDFLPDPEDERLVELDASWAARINDIYRGS